MVLDPERVEHIVEVITREVLLALVEQDQAPQPKGAFCRGECAEGLCVKTCLTKWAR